MHYTKPALSFEDQHDLLLNRGLVIHRLRAMRWLRNVSYYRLSAYFLPFKIGENFKAGTTFNQVAGLYIFDRKLRLCLLDAIERIEVALRTALTYEISHRHGPFGHTAANNFAPWFRHPAFMAELRESEKGSKEAFVQHFRKKYDLEKHLPIWMASELLSLGCISRLYAACHPEVKRRIASHFDVFHDGQFASWLHSLSVIRNVCAHHSRLWNREIGVKPSLPRPSAAFPYSIAKTDRLYCILVIVRHCLLRIAPKCRWRERLFSLFDSHPEVDLSAMQIPPDWRTTPPWTNPLNPVH